MQIEDIKVTSRSNPSQRIIALGIVFAFLYFASNIVITLLLAVLLAYFLDPVVGVLERIHIPRALGALLVLLAVTAMVGGLGYLVVDRADQFLADWPRYSTILRHVTTAFDRQTVHGGKTGRGHFARARERASARCAPPNRRPSAIGCFAA